MKDHMGLRPWMTLKSSDVKNLLSWRISTILKSFLVTSSSCHDALPPLHQTNVRECTKWSWRWSFILWNSISPSSSGGRLPWRRRWISFFDTEKSWWARNLVVQYRSKFFLQRYSVCGMSWQRVRLCGFAFAFDRLAKNTCISILTHCLRPAFLRFPACCRPALCCSSLWPTYSSHEKFWPTSENCLRLQIQVWLHVSEDCL